MRKLNELEAFRGIASIIVFFWHFTLAFIPQWNDAYHPNGSGIAGSWYFFLFNGPASVTFFFVLSGFVLTWGFHRNGNFDLIEKGIFKRYFRLLGPVFVVTLFSWVLWATGCYHNKLAFNLSHSEWLTGSFADSKDWFHADFFQALYEGIFGVTFRGDCWYDTNLWTMKIEFIGSILVFISAPFIAQTKKRNLFLVAVIVFLIIHYTDNQYFLCFILGSLLARFDHKTSEFKFPWYVRLLGYLFVAWAYGFFSFYGNYKFLEFTKPYIDPEVFRMYLWTAASCFFIILLRSGSLVKRIFNGRIGAFLGQMSFPLYLLHALVIGTLSSWMILELAPVWGYSNALWVVLAATILVSFGLSWLLGVFDKFWMGQIKRFTNYIFTKAKITRA